jgi:transposase
VTSDSLPVSVTIGPANEHDSRKLIPLIRDIKIRPREVYADKAYSTVIVRGYLKSRHVKAQIPRISRKRCKGRPPIFDEVSYKKHRSSVERLFSMLKGGFRRLAIRYERRASAFLGFIHMACFIINWRVLR